MTTENTTTIESLTKDLNDATNSRDYWKDRYNDASERSNKNYEDYAEERQLKYHFQSLWIVFMVVTILLLIGLGTALSGLIVGQMIIGAMVAVAAAGVGYIFYCMVRSSFF